MFPNPNRYLGLKAWGKFLTFKQHSQGISFSSFLSTKLKKVANHELIPGEVEYLDWRDREVVDDAVGHRQQLDDPCWVAVVAAVIAAVAIRSLVALN